MNAVRISLMICCSSSTNAARISSAFLCFKCLFISLFFFFCFIENNLRSCLGFIEIIKYSYYHLSFQLFSPEKRKERNLSVASYIQWRLIYIDRCAWNKIFICICVFAFVFIIMNAFNLIKFFFFIYLFPQG